MSELEIKVDAYFRHNLKKWYEVIEDDTIGSLHWAIETYINRQEDWKDIILSFKKVNGIESNQIELGNAHFGFIPTTQDNKKFSGLVSDGIGKYGMSYFKANTKIGRQWASVVASARDTGLQMPYLGLHKYETTTRIEWSRVYKVCNKYYIFVVMKNNIKYPKVMINTIEITADCVGEEVIKGINDWSIKTIDIIQL